MTNVKEMDREASRDEIIEIYYQISATLSAQRSS